MIDTTTTTPTGASIDYVNLDLIASRMDVRRNQLVQRAKTGDFAPVLRISERCYVVRRADLEAWERRSEVSPATTGVHAGHMDTSPAEPFAEPQQPPRRGRTVAAASKRPSAPSRPAAVDRDTVERRRAGTRRATRERAKGR